LAIVSPGTYAFHTSLLLVPLATWQPISVNPADTARGLAFATSFFLLYTAAARAAAHRLWRRRAIWAIVGTGFFMSIEALIQAATASPGKIYGLWRPVYDWAVFGPYVNHNHFANYLVMATPLGVALLIEPLAEISAAWRTRRWLVCGDPPAARALNRAVVVLTLMVGLLMAQSRGGLAAGLLSLALLAFVLQRSRRFAVVLALLLAATLSFVDATALLDSLRGRTFLETRWPLWRDALRAAQHFPLCGAGFNAYGTLSPHYQTAFGSEWVGEAHNEYLQTLVDTGLLGSAIVGALLAMLAQAALREARRNAIGAGVFAALAACALHNVVEFGWQIPANAATFIVLAGLSMREDHARHRTQAAASLDATPKAELESLRSSRTLASR
jgi:O-antigen ligase